MAIDDISDEAWDEMAALWAARFESYKMDTAKRKADDYMVGGIHYKKMAIEPWQLAEILLTKEEFIGALKFGVLKYTLRDGLKPGSDDREKAAHYWQKLREFLENGTS